MSKLNYKKYRGHTKGQWHTCCNNSKYEARCHCGFVFDEGEKSIATVHHNDPKLENYEKMGETLLLKEKQANGRLIEDAPKLFRHCKAADKKLKILRSGIREILEFTDDSDARHILNHLLEKVQF